MSHRDCQRYWEQHSLKKAHKTLRFEPFPRTPPPLEVRIGHRMVMLPQNSRMVLMRAPSVQPASTAGEAQGLLHSISTDRKVRVTQVSYTSQWHTHSLCSLKSAIDTSGYDSTSGNNLTCQVSAKRVRDPWICETK